MDRIHDKKFQIGSKIFFSCYDDFVPHDDDLLILQKPEDNPSYKQYAYMSMAGNCINFWVERPLDEFIQIHLDYNNYILFGKFIVPEFARYIGMTIADLKKLEPLVKKLDKKHKYQEIIYNAYIENNDFVLTDEQRLKAYQSYRQSRNL